MISDEHGQLWEVQPNDPASDTVKLLRSKGFTKIVLPLAVLIHGKRQTGWFWPTVESVEQKPTLDRIACLECCLVLEKSGMMEEEIK